MKKTALMCLIIFLINGCDFAPENHLHNEYAEIDGLCAVLDYDIFNGFRSLHFHCHDISNINGFIKYLSRRF